MRPAILLNVLLIFSVAAFAQDVSPNASIPRIGFIFENSSLDPPYYRLAIGQDGAAEYSNNRPGEAAPDSATHFKISSATRDRIFALVPEVNYFEGDFDFKKHRIAFTGVRTFTYTAGPARHSTRFNWTENRRLSELSAIFEGIAATLESESKLNYLRRYDKLGLNAHLARMEQQAKSGWLKELRLLSQVLNEVANDPSVMHIARQRAEKLGRIADAEASAK
jgi:hypothetical protein